MSSINAFFWQVHPVVLKPGETDSAWLLQELRECDGWRGRWEIRGWRERHARKAREAELSPTQPLVLACREPLPLTSGLQEVYVHIAHLFRSIFCTKAVFQHVFCAQEAVSTGDKLP